MYGNFLTRSLRTLLYMLIQPKNGVRWLANRIERSTAIEQSLPWISYPAIDYLKNYIKEDFIIFEWGSGGSTLFFADRGCRVTSIESNVEWLNKVQSKLKRQRLKYSPEILLIPAETKQSKFIKDYIEAVKANSAWDVVLVDGLEEDYISRLDCVKIAKSLVKKGGIIILDDSWRENYVEIPQILKNYKRLEFWGLGVARLGVTKTDIYINAG